MGTPRRNWETSIRIAPTTCRGLQGIAERLHVSVAQVVRGGVDRALTLLRGADVLPERFLDEQSTTSVERRRSELINVYLRPEQRQELYREARRLQARAAGLIRTAMAIACEELQGVDRLPPAYCFEPDQPRPAAASFVAELEAHAQRLNVSPAAIIRAGVARVVEHLRELDRLPPGIGNDFA